MNQGTSREARERHVIARSKDPFAGSSLVPMLIVGLVLTFAGMIAALALS